MTMARPCNIRHEKKSPTGHLFSFGFGIWGRGDVSAPLHSLFHFFLVLMYTVGAVAALRTYLRPSLSLTHSFSFFPLCFPTGNADVVRVACEVETRKSATCYPQNSIPTAAMLSDG
jgi:hypothetical protein